MIAVIDYGLGNLGSIVNMFKRLGFQATIITKPQELDKFNKLVLPGVGAFDTGMNHLQENGWVEPLNKKVLVDRLPVLGICLGMQLMTKGSEEGKSHGLGWVNAYTRKFEFENKDLRIPHMGWSPVIVTKKSNILPNDEREKRFYFVHSYFVDIEDSTDQLLSANYGKDFCAGFESKNIVGVQFHPEKSHRFGMEILSNFASNFFQPETNVSN